jgi:hypothetical protein
MSWGYWGIVTGFLILLALFFVCVDILYRGSKTADQPGMPASGDQGTAESRNKHAA